MQAISRISSHLARLRSLTSFWLGTVTRIHHGPRRDRTGRYRAMAAMAALLVDDWWEDATQHLGDDENNRIGNLYQPTSTLWLSWNKRGVLNTAHLQGTCPMPWIWFPESRSSRIFHGNIPENIPGIFSYPIIQKKLSSIVCFIYFFLVFFLFVSRRVVSRSWRERIMS